MNELVLSIFPGIDLLGRAFEEEGFCVVRGPDLLWGGDIHNFHPPTGKFAGIIGGPPCVGESQLAYLNGNQGYTLWPEAQRVIQEAEPEWWILEAVKKHDAPHIIKLSPRWIGEKQIRKRYFHSNLNIEPFIDVVLFEDPVRKYTVRAANRASGKGTIRRRQASYPFKEMCELQGLPGDYDIPPFKSEYKQIVVGNAVPMSMGRAIARAVRKTTESINS